MATAGQADRRRAASAEPHGARQGADDRRRLQGAGAGVPGHLDLEDPLSRGPEAARAAAHAGRLPALHAGDVARLRTILRLQRDEFLPLRVIRQELAAGRADDEATPAPAGARRRTARGRAGAPASSALSGRGALYSLEDVLEETGAEPTLVAGARGVRRHQGRAARRRDATTTRPSARSSAPSPSWRATASAGATCASSAPRPTARRRCCSRSSRPALRSRNPERRKEAVEALENLAAVATHLKHLLLIRDLRKIVALSPP